MHTFGNEVRRARIAAGLTQQDLADRTDSDQRTVSLGENWGRGASTPRRVRTLARVLNLSPEWETLGQLEYLAASISKRHRGGDPDQAYADLLGRLPAALKFAAQQ